MNQTRIWPENMNQAIQDVYLWALGRLPNTTESIRIINIHTHTYSCSRCCIFSLRSFEPMQTLASHRDREGEKGSGETENIAKINTSK